MRQMLTDLREPRARSTANPNSTIDAKQDVDHTIRHSPCLPKRLRCDAWTSPRFNGISTTCLHCCSLSVRKIRILGRDLGSVSTYLWRSKEGCATTSRSDSRSNIDSMLKGLALRESFEDFFDLMCMFDFDSDRGLLIRSTG